MQPFDMTENGYSATAMNVTMPPVVTTTTTGSTDSVINVSSVVGFNTGDNIYVGTEKATIQTVGVSSLTLSGTLTMAPAALVAVTKRYEYDVDKLDNPNRAKLNQAIIAANIRSYQTHATSG